MDYVFCWVFLSQLNSACTHYVVPTENRDAKKKNLDSLQIPLFKVKLRLDIFSFATDLRYMYVSAQSLLLSLYIEGRNEQSRLIDRFT